MLSVIRLAVWPQMLRRMLALAVFATLYSPMVTLAAADTPLPGDERVMKQTLPNGVTWLYRQHTNPPGKMHLMMRIDTGSLNETDEQRGLAHFIEHMAFNGTENYPPGDLIKYFESIGMEFGADLNAFTSFEQTAYMLFLPDVTPAQVDRGLQVLSDQAFRLLLKEEEIEKERGVILAEARSRKSAQQRIIDKLFPQLFEGTRFGLRIPIGLDKVISSAPKAQFVDYVSTWYRPEAVTLVMVGDAKPDEYKPLVEKHFGGVKPAAPKREPAKAGFKKFNQQRAIVITDPEYAMAEVELYDLFPARSPQTTEAGFRERLVEEIAAWIIDRRFNERIKDGGVAYQDATLSVEDFFREAVLVNATARGEPGEWAKILADLTTEIVRGDEYGFLPHELELARAELLASAERAVRTESTCNATSIMFEVNGSVNDGDTLLSAEQNLALVTKILPTIDVKEVSAAFKNYVQPDKTCIVVIMPQKDGVAVPTQDQVLLAYQDALKTKPAAPKDQAQALALLEHEPQPGPLGDVKADADLQITHGWLANGVRVHHRFMDYKKDQVLVALTIAGGSIEETAENEGVTQAAVGAYSSKATSRLSSTQITDLLTGKNIRVTLTAGQDSVAVSITGSPKDLETGLQLAHAIISDAKIEATSFDNWKKTSLQQLTMAGKTPEYAAAKTMMKRISGDDPRVTLATPERIEKQSLERCQSWLTRVLRAGAIEAAVVGDMPLDAVRPLLEKYVGSLNARPRKAEQLAALRTLKRQPGPYESVEQIETITPKGVVMCGFIGATVRTPSDVRALQLAAQILDSRLIKRCREELQLVYSISAQNQPGRAYEDTGIFLSAAPCDPAKAPDVVKEVKAIYAALLEQPISAEDLENAKKQVYNNLDNELKEPSYWFALLRTLDYHGINLDDYKKIRESYEAISAEQVQATFKKYSIPARSLAITATPKAAAATTQASPQ